jgi:poly-gamma-glutamate synthesis protein (capsule biosynthesis protein)
MVKRFLFVGDVMLGRLVNDALKTLPPEYPWGDILPIFQGADIRICNLECVIADGGSPWTQTPKVFHFRSDAKNVEVLKAAGISVVSLANNHTLDFGREAMSEMLKKLDQAGIGCAGAGHNLQDAVRPEMLRGSLLQVGFLAFTDNEPAWEATQDRAGVFYVPVDTNDVRAKNLLALINQTKKEVDLLIVSAHWGPNWGYRPQPQHIPFAHALIDAGADIIFGHSCHVFQGTEIYKERPVLYSCGDFIDDYAIDPVERNDQSFIFIVEVTDGGKIQSLQLYPTVIKDFQARLANQTEAQEIATKMRRLCEELGTESVWDKDNNCLVLPM